MFLTEFLFVMLKLVEILAAQDILLHKSSSNISMILVISFLHPPPPPPPPPPLLDFAHSTELHFKLHVLTLNMKEREDWVLLMVVLFEKRIVLISCNVSVTLYLVVSDY